jgi:hypothetical protein
MLEHKLEKASEGHQSRLGNIGGWEIAIIVRKTVRLFDSLWIREICRIMNKTIVPERNDFESTKTMVILDMAEKGAVKGPGSQIVEMTLGSGEE